MEVRRGANGWSIKSPRWSFTLIYFDYVRIKFLSQKKKKRLLIILLLLLLLLLFSIEIGEFIAMNFNDFIYIYIYGKLHPILTKKKNEFYVWSLSLPEATHRLY